MGSLLRHRHLLLLSALILALQGCQSQEEPSDVPSKGGRTGTEWVIEDPAAAEAATPAPVNGSKSLKAGVVWLTDGNDRLSCRYWISFNWDAQAGAYVSKGRLPLSPERPPKMELLLDVRPWTIGNDVRILVEPLAADAFTTAGALSPGRWFERTARDYIKGPHLGTVLERGATDLLSADRPLQDVRLTVVDPERKQTLFVAILKLSEVAGAPTCE